MTADVTATMKWKDSSSLEEKHDQPTQHIKKQRRYSTNKSLSSESYVFSNSHMDMRVQT